MLNVLELVQATHKETKKELLCNQWKPLPTLNKEMKATLVPSTVKLLYYQQTKKAKKHTHHA